MKIYKQGFSIAELIVALGIIAVAILSILALSITVIKNNQKGIDKTVGNVVATLLVERLIDQVRNDEPTGAAADFWENNKVPTPQGFFINDGTEFQYEIAVSPVTNTAGDSVGGVTSKNRLKKVDIVVWWWNSKTEQRQGYGELRVENFRLISEGEI